MEDPVHHVIGGCLVADVELDPDAGHMARRPGEEALLFRHASGLARAYFVCSPDRAEQIRGQGAADRFLAACAAVFPTGAFDRTRVVGPVAFFPGICTYSDRIAGERIVLAGDAAGADDPTQGQGLSLAFRDVRELRDRLLGTDDWQSAIADFAAARSGWFAPLRAFSLWEGQLITDVGPEADAARYRHRAARERDPLLGGYRAIHALGPNGLAASEEARRHYFGQDLDPADSAFTQVGAPEIDSEA
jgi:2-polyprenyl-6-methoxyphenol hydroxylase-like FAD-dependent oxidoreductase